MKRILSLAVVFSFLAFINANGQEYKKLKINLKQRLATKKLVYVEPTTEDGLALNEAFKKSLMENGFVVVNDKDAANYDISLKYSDRKENACGGKVLKDLDGKITDLKNNSADVGSFTYVQNPNEGKCAPDVIKELAKELRKNAD
jgi:hypothetical protein